jgi:hypothetical protein
LIDKRLSIILFFYTIFATGTKIYLLDIIVMSSLFIIFGFLTPNPTSGFAKKKIDFTKRLKRISPIKIYFIIKYSLDA